MMLNIPLITQFLQREGKSGNNLFRKDGILSVPVGMVFERSVSSLNSDLSSSLSTYYQVQINKYKHN